MSNQWVFIVCVHENLYFVKINVKFNKVSCHELSACLVSDRSHKCRLTWNVAAWCSCFSAVLEQVFQHYWAVWSSCFQAFPHPPYLHCFILFSTLLNRSNQCWQVPWMGAHGWVAGICQPWGLYSIWGLDGHSGSPWIPQAPTLHLTRQQLIDSVTMSSSQI